jgi:hypothetical protein
MLLGSAAGYAAAYAIANGYINVQAVDVGHIQKMLQNDGVLLHYPKGHCDNKTSFNNSFLYNQSLRKL